MNDRIANESSIWDLHIHTCQSPKSTGEFQKMSIPKYVDNLVSIFSEFPKLSLISFTDHNYISYEVYEEFIKRETNVKVIPGIELDVNIDGIDDSKHLLFYFDIEFSELKDFADKINKFIDNRQSIKINEVLEYLISNKINFLISPHAFKQGKRGIDFDWNDEEHVTKNAHKFMDQFFCFWEASGHSSIANAIDFLKKIDSQEKISIISFSDSSDSKKLIQYLSNPPQFFKSLPNFKGIQLVGTDSTRILKKEKTIDNNNLGNIIGSVSFDGQNIMLSDRLNAIVGGRGSGKSLLLDKMAINMDSSIRLNKNLKDERIKFLDTRNIEIKNFDNTPINADSKKIDYFNQSYINKIFDSKDISKEIEKYFKDEFEKVDEINKDEELGIIKKIYSDKLGTNEIVDSDTNISNIIGKYKVINDKSIGIMFKKSDNIKITKIEYDVQEAINHAKIGNKIIPAQLKNNKEINLALNNFIKTVVIEQNKYNKSQEILNLQNRIRNECIKFYEKKSSTLKEKNEIESTFLQHLKIEYNPYIERVKIVNAIITIQNKYKPEKSNFIEKNGVEGNIFQFEKKITYEEPINYFRRICAKYLGKKYENISIDELINTFIYKVNQKIDDLTTIDEFLSELKNLNSYGIKYECNILYGKDKLHMKNLINMSPGMQTNILMEYIVSKQTDIPLLIDQPEDNIDNETIYKKLTEWFKKLKLKRQVIVVTHDANIVINADADNVIIATKKDDNSFSYDYGALEYSNIINRISVILDGGIDAVERRLKKYGRQENTNKNQ